MTDGKVMGTAANETSALWALQEVRKALGLSIHSEDNLLDVIATLRAAPRAVPREPTEAMRATARNWAIDCGIGTALMELAIAELWRAMYAAALATPSSDSASNTPPSA
jgi:hypothetical protein